MAFYFLILILRVILLGGFEQGKAQVVLTSICYLFLCISDVQYILLPSKKSGNNIWLFKDGIMKEIEMEDLVQTK